MLKAVIDIGSNSIKMRIANVHDDKIKVISDETEVVRLGRKMSETGMLSPDSMKSSCDTIAKMSAYAKKLHANILMVGTMALRTAKNADEFIKMVKERTGLEINVLSGEDEAKYSWLGATDGFEKNALMFDSGGGSTEFVSNIPLEDLKIASVSVGAVNLSEKFFTDNDAPIKNAVVNEALEYVKNMLLENRVNEFKLSSQKIIGVGGGIVTMASVKSANEEFMPSKLHGSILTQNDIIRQINMYSSLTLKERENIIGLPKSRADVILGSACIILSALKILNAQSCVVSINGLRHGLLKNNSLKI